MHTTLIFLLNKSKSSFILLDNSHHIEPHRAKDLIDNVFLFLFS
jgi:hypothetical protein